jgi:hypothetical protein
MVRSAEFGRALPQRHTIHVEGTMYRPGEWWFS